MRRIPKDHVPLFRKARKNFETLAEYQYMLSAWMAKNPYREICTDDCWD